MAVAGNAQDFRRARAWRSAKASAGGKPTLVVQRQVEADRFLFLGDPQAHDQVQHLEDHEGHHGGVDHGEGHALELHEELRADVLHAAEAIWVTSMAIPAVPLAAAAEPALKPNQPIHSMAAPTRV